MSSEEEKVIKVSDWSQKFKITLMLVFMVGAGLFGWRVLTALDSLKVSVDRDNSKWFYGSFKWDGYVMRAQFWDASGLKIPTSSEATGIWFSRERWQINDEDTEKEKFDFFKSFPPLRTMGTSTFRP